MSYYERDLGQSGVLCDECGAKRFVTTTGHYDQGSWCWAPRYSSGFHPCDECRHDANRHVPAYLAGFSDVTA